MPLATPPALHGRATRRKFAFFVTTTGSVQGIRSRLGSAGYSYFFAYEALLSVLERFGTCRLVERPESRLAWLADQARAQGLEPIHLAINPPQETYLTPAIPTIVYPFWEFPGIPDRDFGVDTRQNWARILAKADAVAVACEFTAQALRRDGLPETLAVIPIPLNPAWFEVPDWTSNWTWNHVGGHEVWINIESGPADEPFATLVSRDGDPLRRLFGRVASRLSPRTLQAIYRWKRALVPNKGESLGAKWYGNARSAYLRHVRRWLSDDAVGLVTRAKRKALRLLRVPEKISVLPGLPVGHLALEGLVYTTIFGVGDHRKNSREILSAFLMAFQERADVTLVVKLVTNPAREHHEVGVLREQYRGLGIHHACKVVVLTEYLNDEQMLDLFRATTYYVNHSFAEGACLPLQQALAAGRPALAPDHSAMSDYVDDQVAFVTRSSPEPIHWPHDPEQRIETYRFRPLWADLRRHFLESAAAAEHDQARYRTLAGEARRRMQAHAGQEVVADALARLLERMPVGRPASFDWPSQAHQRLGS